MALAQQGALDSALERNRKALQYLQLQPFIPDPNGDIDPFPPMTGERLQGLMDFYLGAKPPSYGPIYRLVKNARERYDREAQHAFDSSMKYMRLFTKAKESKSSGVYYQQWLTWAEKREMFERMAAEYTNYPTYNDNPKTDGTREQ
jgi:hypothetical protein